MTQNRQNSAWEDSFKSERQRQVANQGGAKDAQRRMTRHQNANTRNPNRTVVSSYSYHQLDEEQEFNAVAPENRKLGHRGGSPSFGERNAHASWSSSSNGGFPRSRNSTGAFRSLIIPAIVVVVLFVIVALIVHGCMG